MIIPSTVYQLLSVLLLVVPGIVFAGVRRTLVGPSPEDRDFSVRLVRALATSALFDGIYLIVGGPEIVRFIREKPQQTGSLVGFAGHPREAAGLALLLLVAIPAVAACVPFIRFLQVPPSQYWLRKVLQYPNQSTPSAWDYAAPNRGGCFVRVFTEDNRWVGGALGGNAFVSTYPEPRDIFIEEEWVLDENGGFVEPVENSLGIYVPLGSSRVAWLASTDGTKKEPT